MRPPHKSPDSVAIGRVGASGSTVGLFHPAMREAMSDYRRLNTEPARAAFADRWIRQSARRLEEVWPMLYELLAIVRDQQLYTRSGYLEGGKTYPDFGAYFEATMGQPFARWKELEDTYHFVREYAPAFLDAPYSAALAELRVLDEQDAATKRNDGRPAKTVDSINSFSRPDGTSRQHALRRLRRDRADLHARVIAGELTPHGAMVEAGFRKRPIQCAPTPKATAAAIRRHFTPEQIAELVRLLEEPT